MRSARFRLFWVSFFLIQVSSVFAVDPQPPADELLAELGGIKGRLVLIESAQQAILVQRNDMLKKIEDVRVWVRHSGGSKTQAK